VVDYTPIAIHGIIGAKIDPLNKNILFPNPPDTQSAQNALASVWKLDKKIQLGRHGSIVGRVVEGTKDRREELKLEGIKFDRYEDVVEATANKGLSKDHDRVGSHDGITQSICP